MQEYNNTDTYGFKKYPLSFTYMSIFHKQLNQTKDFFTLEDELGLFIYNQSTNRNPSSFHHK